MIQRGHWIGLLFAATFVWGAERGSNVPVENFRLPWYDDEAGRVTAELSGAEARILESGRIEITRLLVRMLGENGADSVEMEITSPLALVDPDAKVASGPGQLRITTPEFEVHGEDWRYDHPSRTATIQRDVVAVFSHDLGRILP